MKIIQARSPVVIEYIKPLLLEDEDTPREVFASILAEVMDQDPDNTFIEVAFEQEECLGFIIARCMAGQKHVFVYQTWFGPELDNPTRDKMFLYLMQWSVSRDRYTLRAETKRNPEAFKRRWGFEPYSEIISFSIPEDFGPAFVRSIIKENKNGKGQWTTDDEHVDGESAEGSESDEQADPVRPDLGPSELQGSDSSSDDPGAESSQA